MAIMFSLGCQVEINNANSILNMVGYRKVRVQDLHLKLQRKGLQSASQSGKSYAPNMRVLRERLTGTMTVQPTNVDLPKSKVVKPSSKNVGVEVPAVHIKRP
ncbi:unnamed protein product [Sphenostylis stenocarpa]|uniref:Uncharacterized protein n=1 Tax=Sphenostylis stenocarpa TaxID=92480 RepID=A0AA86SDN8_9FABA|nr:unnamed protein product [Sphenostylis stenocarpa]